ncbi:hypothetical protein C900_00119 [Fulvivirga imtechensis AK7]|uniref:Uncharacterized protein n=1 Tax=Fulvivirga imtechensis AK7 TaxID=1237149 RepID=L8JZF0_9BACT|nr:hypothetical protein [Fulvivirga imtechensis]ELR73039.1 hypothetical protein C900_00119 [Fulvivirga imtechensis AK7]
MKRFFSISLLVLFLIRGLAPTMDLCCELQKLPVLFEHYEEHKACSGGSFWKFLVQEYASEHVDSDQHHDNADHDKLPFHSNDQCCNTAIFYVSDQHFELRALDSTLPVKSDFYISFLSSRFPDSLFQPPQV